MADEPMDVDAAQAAIDAARVQLAAQAHWPWSRHASGAAVMGAMVASQAAPAPLAALITGLLLLAVALIVSTDRARRGVFINGWRAGKTQWIAIVLAVISVGALFAGMRLHTEAGLWWAPLALGAVVFVIALALSKLWEVIYRREMEKGA